MFRRYTFWLKTAATFQILTACLHSVSFFVNQEGSNDAEKEMVNLMSTLRLDMGQGFTPTMNNLITSMSAGFALMLLLGGLINWFLLTKHVGTDILKGVLVINLIVFGITFIANVFLTFIPPIVTTGLIFLFLLIAFFALPRSVNAVG